MLFTSADGRHTVSLVVMDGGDGEEDFNRRLGAVLRAMRLSTRDAETGKRLTQEQAAQLVDRDADVIGRWERGDSLPRLDRLAEVAEAYGVPPEQWHLLLRPPSLPQPAPLAGILEERQVSLAVLSPAAERAADEAADEVASRATRRAGARRGTEAPSAQDTRADTNNRGVA